MNIRMIGRILSQIVWIEAAFLIPALGISLGYGEAQTVRAFLLTLCIMGSISGLLWLVCRNANKRFGASEGMISVSLGWIVISLFGCLPFLFSGQIPSFIDALFETVSGFTTTGSTVLSDVESLSKGLLYWRSFTNWLGGMGVLVFLLAVAPSNSQSDGFTMHLLRAESPGPDVGKLVPRMKKTAAILYLIYIALTFVNFLFLLFGNMSVLDALCTAFSTAGTGGFGIRNDSFATFSPYIQNVTTVFLFLFGVNFSCFYLLLLGNFKSVFKDEELRLYLGFAFTVIVLITLNIFSMYPSWADALRHASFQVASIMSTSGFATTDFDLWPMFSKGLLLLLMILGGCAGATAGGLKYARLLLLWKSMKRNIRKLLNPKKVEVVRINGRAVSETVVDHANAYLAAYVLIVVVSFLAVSVDGQTVGTNLSAVLSCFNNIGPGLDAVGPTCTFGFYSPFSKLVLIFDMLAGRLEIFPLLILFSRYSWKKQ